MRRQLIALAVGAVLALSACSAGDEAETTALPVTESTPPSASIPASTSSTSTSSSGTTTSSTSTSVQSSAGVSATDATIDTTTEVTAGGAEPDPSGSTGSTGSSDQAGPADPADPAAPVEPAELDEATIRWFDSFCAGAVTTTKSENRLAELDPDFADPEIAQADYADLLVEVGTGYDDFAADLSTQPPPTISGGDAIHTALVDGFTGLGAAYLNAADTFGSATVNDEAGYNAAVSAAQTSIAAAEAVLNAQFNSVTTGISELGEEIQASVRAIPSCQQAFGVG